MKPGNATPATRRPSPVAPAEPTHAKNQKKQGVCGNFRAPQMFAQIFESPGDKERDDPGDQDHVGAIPDRPAGVVDAFFAQQQTCEADANEICDDQKSNAQRGGPILSRDDCVGCRNRFPVDFAAGLRYVAADGRGVSAQLASRFRFDMAANSHRISVNQAGNINAAADGQNIAGDMPANVNVATETLHQVRGAIGTDVDVVEELRSIFGISLWPLRCEWKSAEEQERN